MRLAKSWTWWRILELRLSTLFFQRFNFILGSCLPVLDVKVVAHCLFPGQGNWVGCNILLDDRSRLVGQAEVGGLGRNVIKSR
jgi:hypothetical protein